MLQVSLDNDRDRTPTTFGLRLYCMYQRLGWTILLISPAAYVAVTAAAARVSPREPT
ncbi:hypothetical protein BJX96DRAFT_152062 [Aspergillus floccosus]